ncbi:MAG: M28 family peptidase [bacterium]
MKILFASVLIAAAPAAVLAQGKSASPDPWAALSLPRTHAPQPTHSAITAGDLQTRLYLFADDSMQGRRAGWEGNRKGVEWIASEAKRMGLKPAGDNGTYFQQFEKRFQVRDFDTTKTLSVEGKALHFWTDFIPRDPGRDPRSLDNVQTVWGGDWKDSSSVITDAASAGKLVVITSSVTVPGNPGHVPSRPIVAARFPSAAGVAVVVLDELSDSMRAGYKGLSGYGAGPLAPSYLYITRDVAERIMGQGFASLPLGTAGKPITGSFGFNTSEQVFPTDVPLRNVVALLPGTDPVLKNEYVVIGAHNDHIGFNKPGANGRSGAVAHDSMYIVNHLYRKSGADDAPPTLDASQQHAVDSILAHVRKMTNGKSARADSISNGADDDGTGTVSLLEIGEYFAKSPIKTKRSILLVWHVGEELGLWGSEYFTDHPTVSRDAIVAELNIDMVGRGGANDQTGATIDGKAILGGKGYLQLVGSRRLSTELGDMAERVNASGKHNLKFDYALDANGHPANIYCRSDHYEYARYGIPIVFFTTGGHADYHQVTDEPQYIDYPHMAQVDSYIADLAVRVANLDHRVAVDKPKPDPHGSCQQ